MRILNL
ncbi:hypothetical protein GQ607_015747 [Colletotrichum asianum]|nr:hypothetical protein GQ607_015747 [Colletotrichum asianum]